MSEQGFRSVVWSPTTGISPVIVWVRPPSSGSVGGTGRVPDTDGSHSSWSSCVTGPGQVGTVGVGGPGGLVRRQDTPSPTGVRFGSGEWTELPSSRTGLWVGRPRPRTSLWSPVLTPVRSTHPGTAYFHVFGSGRRFVLEQYGLDFQ